MCPWAEVVPKSLPGTSALAIGTTFVDTLRAARYAAPTPHGQVFPMQVPLQHVLNIVQEAPWGRQVLVVQKLFRHTRGEQHWLPGIPQPPPCGVQQTPLVQGFAQQTSPALQLENDQRQHVPPRHRFAPQHVAPAQLEPDAEQQTPALHVAVHSTPHPPQLVLESRAVSQPSDGSWLQSPHPELHASNWQVPFEQNAVAWGKVQTLPHCPQFWTSRVTSVSHPAVFWSQSANPGLHVHWHTPAAHEAVEYAAVQSCPHCPQFALSVLVSISQPSCELPLQFANPPGQGVQMLGSPLHANPGSPVHVEEHPSPAVWLPSSHCSLL